MKFYVMTHHTEFFTLPKCYVLFNVKYNYMQDNSDSIIQLKGDNISYKNLYYSELSGLYYLFKNSKDNNYGITHYRRFFTRFYYNRFLFKKLSCNAANKLLQNYDIILPKKLILKENVYDHYRRNHIVKDLELTKCIIYKRYPDFYDVFTSTLDTNAIYPYNMFITSKNVINEYYDILFKIFYQLESELTINKIDSRDNYQKRVFGFLAERIFTAWVNYKKLSIKEMRVLVVIKNPSNKLNILIPSFLIKSLALTKKYLKSIIK